MTTPSPIEVLSHTEALTLIAFPPTHLAILRPATPTTAAQALEMMPEALAVLDGPMGSLCRGVSQPQDYAHATCGDVDTLLYDTVTRVLDTGKKPQNGLTFSLKGSEIHVARGERYPAGADYVEQTYPSLVENGANVASEAVNTDRNWRSAMGLLRDGKAFLAIGYAPMHEFAQRLIGAGATWAGYTDGGGSVALQVRGDSRRGSSENRRVFSWVVVLARPRPGTSGSATLVVHNDAPPTRSTTLTLPPPATSSWFTKKRVLIAIASVAATATVVGVTWTLTERSRGT